MALINLSGIATGDWTFVADDAPLFDLAEAVVSLERLLAEGTALAADAVHLGVVLRPDDAVEALGPHLADLAFIAITFPQFTDGRGYSQAHRLRQEFGFQGELRAIGDVLADQAWFMARAGFDTLELAPGVDPATVKSVLERYKFAYQPGSSRYPGIMEQRLAAHSEPEVRRAS